LSSQTAASTIHTDDVPEADGARVGLMDTCKTKRAPKEMGGLTTDITDRLPAGVNLGRKTTANLGKIMRRSAGVPVQKVRARKHAHTHSHPHVHTQ